MTATRIVVIGAGRIGAVTAVGLAHLGWDVVGLDTSAERVAALSAGRLPEMEPGLRSALAAGLRFRRLRFAGAGEAGAFELAFLCVDTPPLPSGEPDLRQILTATADAALLLAAGGVLVTRSTVPVGTGGRLTQALIGVGRGDVQVVHVPEFLREGHAWEDFREPDRIVVGGECERAIERVRAVFAALERPLFITDRRTAELAKYAANAFLATSVSFANEMADLCDALTVDAADVFAILRADRRIGPHAYLAPGLGFGGHCLPKDTAALEQTAALYGQAAVQLQATRQINRARVFRPVAWLRRMLDGLDGRRVCLAGLSFKPGTDDMRESPALRLARTLAFEGADVTAWDPLVRGPVVQVDACDDIETAATGADALVIAHGWTGWCEFDPGRLRAVMRRAIVYDAPGVLDAVRWADAGFVSNRRVRRPAGADLTH